MRTYQVILHFSNLDNSLYTDTAATMKMEIQSQDISHAYLLAERLERVMGADRFDVEVI